MAKDNSEHMKSGVYEKFCAPRFKALEEDIKDTRTIVHKIDRVVHDGLKEKVDGLKKQNNWLLSILISLLLLIIGSTVTLYLSNNHRVDQVDEKIERLLDDH